MWNCSRNLFLPGRQSETWKILNKSDKISSNLRTEKLHNKNRLGDITCNFQRGDLLRTLECSCMKFRSLSFKCIADINRKLFMITRWTWRENFSFINSSLPPKTPLESQFFFSTLECAVMKF
jgi:hypothetical protein